MIANRFELSIWSPSKRAFVKVPGLVSEATKAAFEAKYEHVRASLVEETSPRAEQIRQLCEIYRDVETRMLSTVDRLKLQREIRARASRLGVKLSLTEAGR